MIRLVLAASMLALVLPIAATGSSVEARIRSGTWRGVNWEFRGGAWRDGSYCVAMRINGRETGRGCGTVRREDGIDFVAGGNAPDKRVPDYVIGAVLTRARTVRIEFFDNRAPVRLGTIPAPRTLEGGVRFFVAVLPCPVIPKKLVARDATGQVVARFTWHHAPPKWSC